MNKEELHIKAIDNANSRIKTVDKRYLTALADYDLGLIQGFEDGAEWMQAYAQMQDINEGKALLYAVDKTAKRTKKETLREILNWINARYDTTYVYTDITKMLKDEINN